MAKKAARKPNKERIALTEAWAKPPRGAEEKRWAEHIRTLHHWQDRAIAAEVHLPALIERLDALLAKLEAGLVVEEPKVIGLTNTHPGV